jgi:hypothetical protein
MHVPGHAEAWGVEFVPVDQGGAVHLLGLIVLQLCWLGDAASPSPGQAPSPVTLGEVERVPIILEAPVRPLAFLVPLVPLDTFALGGGLLLLPVVIARLIPGYPRHGGGCMDALLPVQLMVLPLPLVPHTILLPEHVQEFGVFRAPGIPRSGGQLGKGGDLAGADQPFAQRLVHGSATTTIPPAGGSGRSAGRGAHPLSLPDPGHAVQDLLVLEAEGFQLLQAECQAGRGGGGGAPAATVHALL